MQGRGVNNISQLSLFLNSLQTTYVYLRVSARKKLRYEKHVWTTLILSLTYMRLRILRREFAFYICKRFLRAGHARYTCSWSPCLRKGKVVKCCSRLSLAFFYLFFFLFVSCFYASCAYINDIAQMSAFILYSLLSANTGSFFAACFDGIRPPINVKITLKITNVVPPAKGRVAVILKLPVNVWMI